MATNKRDLRAYVRYDGTGRIIPGSLVLRRSKPKVGDWKEIQTYECCDGGGGCNVPLSDLTICRTFTFDEEFLNNPIKRFELIASDSLTYSSFMNCETPTFESVVECLNLNFSFLGLFTYSAPNQICLNLSSSGTIGYNVSLFPNPLSWNINIIT